LLGREACKVNCLREFWLAFIKDLVGEEGEGGGCIYSVGFFERTSWGRWGGVCRVSMYKVLGDGAGERMEGQLQYFVLA